MNQADRDISALTTTLEVDVTWQLCMQYSNRYIAVPSLRYFVTSSLACDLSVGSDSSILTNSVNTCGSALILSSTTLSKDTVLSIGSWTWFVAFVRATEEMMDLLYSLLAMLDKSL